MTYAKLVKEELCNLKTDKRQQLVELMGMFFAATTYSIIPRQITFKSSNLVVIRRFLTLIKSLYQIKDTALQAQELSFTNNRYYHLSINENIDQIISEFDFTNPFESLEEYLLTENDSLCFLRGVFLSSGSVNHPKTANYHLEIFQENPTSAVYIQTIMNQFELNAKLTKRRQGFITYLKNVDSIIDYLRLIGASQTVFIFEDLKIKRELNSSITRVMNIELANENKVAKVAFEQIRYIKIIQQHKITLDVKLQDVAILRLENEDASLKELVEIYNQTKQDKITKSGLNHRFLRIKEIALELIVQHQSQT